MLFAFILKFKLKEKTIMRQSLIAVGMFLLTGGMVGCGTSSTQEKEDLIVVDVSKDYPKKELILQDLFDVEYIPLETTDEFVTLGWLQAIGKDVMIIRNMWAVDGDIFIYDRKGKAIRHINRKGQGNEEYAATNGIYLDDDMIGFVNDCGYDDEAIELGYVIDPAFQGRGFATEAVNAVINELREMGFKKVVADFFEENIGSRKVMEKCGMHLNGNSDYEEYRGKKFKCYECEMEL